MGSLVVETSAHSNSKNTLKPVVGNQSINHHLCARLSNEVIPFKNSRLLSRGGAVDGAPCGCYSFHPASMWPIDNIVCVWK